MCRLNLRDYLARPKQHSSGDGSSSLSSSPLLSFSPPLHTSPQQVLLSSFWWLPWLAQACWSMLPKSACRRSLPRSLLPRSSLKPNRNIRHWASAYPTVILLNVFFVGGFVYYLGWLWGPLRISFRQYEYARCIYNFCIFRISWFLIQSFWRFPTVWGL